MHFFRLCLSGVAILLSFTSSVQAADGTPVWTNYIGNAGNGGDYIALDNNGNVIVSGDFSLSNATVKYSDAGVALWTNFFNSFSGGQSIVMAVATDTKGNVYVTEESSLPSSSWEFATIKYSTAGVPLWTNFYQGSKSGSVNAPESLAVDTNGNVFVTGNSTDIGSGSDYATIKYSSTGLPLWTNIFNGAGNGSDSPISLALDSAGNVFVTGSSTGNGSGLDFATIKYSNAGLPLWTNTFNGTGNGTDKARSIALDSNGNAVIAGYTTGAGSGFDFATIKYSNAGAALWTNIFNGPGNGNDVVPFVALDGSGNVFVAGSSTGNAGYYDFTTIKYSSAGVPLWTNFFNGVSSGNSRTFGIALDGNGNVYVTGYSITNSAYYLLVTIKYSNAGLPLWTNISNFGGSTDSQGWGLAADAVGNVYVTGHAYLGNYVWVTVKYSAPPLATLNLFTTNGGFDFVNNQFSLLATGPAASNVVISASTDLHAWTPLITNPLGSGAFNFTDRLTTNCPIRFYRGTLLP